MQLLVGLGNPGREHAENRHNVGFMALETIMARHGFARPKVRFSGVTAEGTIGGERVLALMPQTYMNDSGRSVGAAARFLKIEPAEVTVIYDELDLAPGRVRVKRGGGAGGHNGIRSIDAHLGRDYRRVRIGIGHPGDKDRVTGYVLSDFAKAERQGWVRETLDAVADAAPMLVAGDDAGFMNKVTLLNRPPRPAAARPAGDE